MRTILKQAALVATTICMCLLADAQGKSTPQKNTKLDSSKPAILTNNNELLSKKGIESINISDVIAKYVWKDTLLITVKEEVLMRLNKDSSNYAKLPKGAIRLYNTVAIKPTKRR